MSIMYFDKTGKIAEEKYVGQVLCLGEHNYYDDSDFYALVFDPKDGKVHEIIYDTTRFASTGMNAVVDATEETLKAYREARENLEKKITVDHAWFDHNSRLAIHKSTGLTFKEIGKLCNVYSHDGACFDAVCSLLSVKKFRSEFRKGLADHIREWLADPKPKYFAPLSDRQMECIFNKHIPSVWGRFNGGSAIYDYPIL